MFQKDGTVEKFARTRTIRHTVCHTSRQMWEDRNAQLLHANYIKTSCLKAVQKRNPL